jgi:hypothetical protein
MTSRFVILVFPLLTTPAAAEEAPSYQKHIVALFSKLGCNGGTCHGAVRGQNGFRLSLFGADPQFDRERLLREAGGRRLDLADPDASLLLQKASGRVAHGGGMRASVGSWEYEVLRRWVAAGAPADAPGPAQVKELRALPVNQAVKPGEAFALRVEAKFADGSTADVTRYCSYQSLDNAVAAVDAAGRVEGRSVGDAAVIVRYRAVPAMARVLVPRPGMANFPEVAANNVIDRHVLDKLRRLNLPPSPLADDATFFRRASLDVTGELPTPDEVRRFLADADPAKRAKKIDELLARPGHAAVWTLKFCDLLKAADYGVYADALSLEADAPRFQAWVRARLRENVPYDQFVERILLATSREGRTMEQYADELARMMDGNAPGRPDLEMYKRRKTLDLYWQRRGSDGVSGALQVAHAFLGLRLECAQCHRHPHDVWQQDDLLSFANFFMRVRKVGFEGDNEKRYPDAAALFKKFNDEGKKLEAEVKKRKETDGKKMDEETKKARTEADRLAREISQIEKDKAKADELARKKQELAGCKETMAKGEKFRQELAEQERKAKLMPEIARRLLQAEVRLKPPGTFARVTSPIGTQESKTLRLLGETQNLSVPDDRDPRELVVDWMRRPDNPYFARAIVNRVWAHYFGRGVVDPPDNLSPFNPATHPELLKELCDGFVANKYDLRWLHRTILSSRTYQQSSLATRDNEADRANYAYYPLRRLPAEVLLDALNTATGTTEPMDMKYYHWPDDMKVVEVPFVPKNPFVAYVLESFGRPKRNAAVQCDCERDGGASVFQVLTLANHPRVWEKLRDANGRVANLARASGDDGSKVDELFLATVSRMPTGDERAACLSYLRAAESPEKGLQGVLWGLLNTREFVLQH